MTDITDIPIIFSAPMVRALLDGRKTMTRRLAWTHPGKNGRRATRDPHWPPGMWPSAWQNRAPGDRLWVRESLSRFQTYGALKATCHYPADHTGVIAPAGRDRDASGRAIWQWEKQSLPSIHMPRWASRLTLVVTASKIARLYDISDDDVRAEGITETDTSWLNAWRQLWETIHGPKHWDTNPDVVALTFTVHKQNIDTLPSAAAA